MKKIKNEKGAITILVLVSILFIVSFLISLYSIVANKVKAQKEMVKQTEAIYDNGGTMQEIYDSYFIDNEIIPIYSNEQYLSIGNGNNIYIEEAGGKYYRFSNDATYVLMRDLTIKEDELPQNWEAPEYNFENNSLPGKIDYNGHIVRIIDNNGDIVEEYDGIIKSILPIEYIQLEYIESTGSQYIDTGVIGKTGIEVYADIMYKEVSTDGSFIASRNGSTRFYPVHSYPSKWCIGYGEYTSTDVSINVNTKYSIYSKLYNGEQKLEVDEETIYSNNISGDINTNLNLYIFGMNYNGALSKSVKARLYSMKIYFEGKLVRDYIPAYNKINGKIGLYDTVEQEFYTDPKGEDFVCSPIKNNINNYIQLEYIESTGNQYIDTGVIGKTGIEVYADIMYKEVSTDGSFIASRNGSTRFYPVHSYPSKWCIGYGEYTSTNVSINANTKYSIYSKLYNGEQKLEVDEETIYSNNISGDINTNLNLYIFGMNYNGALSKSVKARLYSMKIYFEGELVRDYIPVYCELDGKVGLFDKVQSKFYMNQTENNFIIPEIEESIEYTPIEYIESTGSQYIDTGVIGKTGIEVYANMMYKEVLKDGSFIASRNGSTRFYPVHSYPSKWCIGYGEYTSTDVSINANTKYSIYSKLYNGEQKLEVDEETIYSNNISGDINTNLNLYIFGMNYNGALSNSVKARLYSMKIYENGEIIRDFIPCYINKPITIEGNLYIRGTLGLYDKVNNKFYPKRGSENFIAGSDVVE